MQRLLEKLPELIAELRSSYSSASFGEDPIHDLLKKLRSGREGDHLSVLLGQSLQDTNYVWFLAQTGLSQEGGFFSELIRRLEERTLPPLLPENDILWLLSQLFEDSDKTWLKKITPSQLGRLIAFLTEGHDTDFKELTAQMRRAIEILAQRISGLGLDPFISSRLREKEELVDHFLELGSLSFDENNFSPSKDFLETLLKCERSLLFVRGRMEQEGTSLALTYRLFHIEELIHRLKMILNASTQFNSDYKFSALGVLFKQILIAHLEKIRLRGFLGRNIEILAYQVTLLTGNTGEHYITSSKQELLSMWWKAIKGGMIVACLVIIKLFAAKLHLAPLPQALVYGCIYATGFVAIHLVGGVLATKQPAMTASTLAASLGADSDGDTEKNMNNLVDVVVRMLRSQLAALFGNYLTAFPIVVLIAFPFLIWGHPMADAHKADVLIHDLHPLWSLSFMYAAIAGVCLFISGLICGLADNWFNFNQMEQRLAHIFPSERSAKVINYFRKNFGIWASNITLGFMLGSMSSIGSVLGLPLDIRHVTFASGGFGLGWIHQPEQMPWDLFALIAASVFVMGLINLAVSFSLSLLVAMKSRRLKFYQGGTLAWLLLKRLLKSPHELFFTK